MRLLIDESNVRPYKRVDGVGVEDVAAATLLIDTSKMGKKAARDAERRALAMQRTKDEESSSSGEQQQLNGLHHYLLT